MYIKIYKKFYLHYAIKIQPKMNILYIWKILKFKIDGNLISFEGVFQTIIL